MEEFSVCFCREEGPQEVSLRVGSQSGVYGQVCGEMDRGSYLVKDFRGPISA